MSRRHLNAASGQADTVVDRACDVRAYLFAAWTDESGNSDFWIEQAEEQIRLCRASLAKAEAEIAAFRGTAKPSVRVANFHDVGEWFPCVSDTEAGQ